MARRAGGWIHDAVADRDELGIYICQQRNISGENHRDIYSALARGNVYAAVSGRHEWAEHHHRRSRQSLILHYSGDIQPDGRADTHRWRSGTYCACHRGRGRLR